MKILKKIKKKLRKIKKSINKLMIRIINQILSILPLQENTVLFLSDVRENLGGNLKYLYDIIPDDKYKKIISTKADRRVKRKIIDRIKLVYYLSVAKYILLDDFSNITSHIRVRKNQELIQLWHGPGAYKKFGHSRSEDKNGDIKVVHPGYKKYTKAITSSESIRSCYAEAFSINIDKVKATGFPRTDMFFNDNKINEHKEALYKKYPFLKGKKVILFAPTYRGTKVKQASYDFDKLDVDKIYEKYKKEYIFIFKWHPAIYNNILFGKVDNYDLSKYKDFYYDLSSERDINDLLLVTDILITDYSSVIFDYYFMNKPIIYFAYDLEDYANGRGLYFPFNEYVYGKIATNDDELIEAIDSKELCLEDRKKFFDKFLGACDGHSTQKTYEWIFGEK